MRHTSTSSQTTAESSYSPVHSEQQKVFYRCNISNHSRDSNYSSVQTEHQKVFYRCNISNHSRDSHTPLPIAETVESYPIAGGSNLLTHSLHQKAILRYIHRGTKKFPSTCTYHRQRLPDDFTATQRCIRTRKCSPLQKLQREVIHDGDSAAGMDSPIY